MKNLFVSISVVFCLLLGLTPDNVRAEVVEFHMVFVPASEKGDDKDYTNLIEIIGERTGYTIKPIKVTDYNAAVEAMRAE